MSDTDETISVEMERFRGKSTRRESSPHAAVNSHRIALNQAARELTDRSDYPYVHFFVGKDNMRVGIKPVKDGEVDANSYSFTDCSVGCKTVLREIDVEFGAYSDHYAVRWLDDEKMFVVDFGEKHD